MEIAEAFVTEEESPEAAPVADGLRAVVPAPAGAEVTRLEEVSSRHRVLLLRAGAVIAVSTVISVGGALLFHALLAGLVVIGIWFPGIVPARGSGALPGQDAGGSPGGFTVLGNGPDDNAAPAALAPSLLGTPVTGLASVLPQLPEVSSTHAAAQLSVPVMPAISPTQDLGQIRIQPAVTAAAVSPAPVPPGPSVAPPGDPVVSAGQPGPVGMPARGTDAGDGGGEEERIFGLVKGDGSGGTGSGGSGSGTGAGKGSGINRGLSAADRQPQLLSFGSSRPNFALPLEYQLHPPEKPVCLVLNVAADGTISAARLEQSCGIPEIDEMVRGYVLANFHFSPAYRAGRAVAAEFQFEMSFKPID